MAWSYLIPRSIPAIHEIIKCPKRNLLTKGGQIPIEKHYHSFCRSNRRSYRIESPGTPSGGLKDSVEYG